MFQLIHVGSHCFTDLAIKSVWLIVISFSLSLSPNKPFMQLIARATPFKSPAALHFMGCLRRFGSPGICLNLGTKRERRKRESLLTDELHSSISYLNHVLSPEHHIKYIHRDMARINMR